MSPEGWTAVAGIVASVCALAAVVVQSRSTSRRLDATQEMAAGAKTSADAAAANSLPVSNGFTADVRAALRALQDGQDEVQHRLGRVEGAITGHLQAHATSDLQRPRSPIG